MTGFGPCSRAQATCPGIPSSSIAPSLFVNGNTGSSGRGGSTPFYHHEAPGSGHFVGFWWWHWTWGLQRWRVLQRVGAQDPTSGLRIRCRCSQIWHRCSHIWRRGLWIRGLASSKIGSLVGFCPFLSIFVGGHGITSASIKRLTEASNLTTSIDHD